MGTDPVSTDLPLVAPMTADKMVDYNQKLRDAIQAATIQRDNHAARTAEQIREDQLNAESVRLAAQLAAIQADAAERDIPLTGIAAMRAAAAADVVPESSQPIEVPAPIDGATDAAELSGEEFAVEQIPANVPVVVPAAEISGDMDLPVSSEVTE